MSIQSGASDLPLLNPVPRAQAQASTLLCDPLAPTEGSVGEALHALSVRPVAPWLAAVGDRPLGHGRSSYRLVAVFA